MKLSSFKRWELCLEEMTMPRGVRGKPVEEDCIKPKSRSQASGIFVFDSTWRPELFWHILFRRFICELGREGVKRRNGLFPLLQKEQKGNDFYSGFSFYTTLACF